MKIEVFADVNDHGDISIFNTARLRDELKQFYGKRIKITYEAKSKRSLAQNNYIHHLFTEFKEQLNALGNEFTMEQVKEMCKVKFAIIDVINKESGEVIGQRSKGTSEMDKFELNEFFEKVIIWAADMFHIQLAFPSEQISAEL